MRKVLRGSIAIELLVILPFIALAFVTLIGVAEILLLKRQAIVVAQYAGLHVQMGGEKGSAPEAVAETNNKWSIAQVSRGDEFLEALHISDGGGVNVAGLLFKLVGTDEGGPTEFTAELSGESNFLRRVVGDDRVKSKYVVPLGFWDSDNCDLFMSLLKDRVQMGSGSILP